MAQDFDLIAYLPYLLNRAGSRIADSFSALLREEHGISLQMWRVVAALHHRDGQRVGELSDTTSIEISTLSRLLTTMERRGLVERRRASVVDGSGDARVVLVRLTETGWAVTEQIIPVAMSYEAVALRGLGARETAQLRALLTRVYDNLAGLDEDSDAEKIAS